MGRSSAWSRSPTRIASSSSRLYPVSAEKRSLTWRNRPSVPIWTPPTARFSKKPRNAVSRRGRTCTPGFVIGLAALPGSDEEVRRHHALALDVDLASRREREAVAHQPVEPLGALDSVADAVRFHPARGVDGVAPQVVD